tara:strand:+ start:1084 stop:1761 length:678 start_codon:yes stop_codon:yes gene_type:complete
MDGNNRWAKANDLPGVSGHKEGVERAREAVEYAVERKIETLTLFAFSSENWGRSEKEVSLLMDLLAQALEEQVPNLVKNKVQLSFIGDLKRFNPDLQSRMKKAEELTICDQKNLDLVIAASYGGRWDIVQAIQKIKSIKEEIVVDEDLISSYTSLAPFSDPDFCIRTGGENRVSNFLLWHLAYSELYFSNIFWPDFDNSQFEIALNEYSKRQRRFGDQSNFINSK